MVNFHTVWEPVKGFHTELREPCAGLSVFKYKKSAVKKYRHDGETLSDRAGSFTLG